MKLLLLINNNWESPEMDREQNELSLNYHYAGLDSPADYVGEFAMDFKIPRTQHNNRLFEQYFRVDSVVTPLNLYNPAIKIPYKILSDYGDVISEGNGYINNITKTDYIFALSGAFSSIFSKAMNSGWNTQKANEDEEYFLLPEYLAFDGATFTTPPVISAKLVYWSWNSQNNTFDWDFLKQRYNHLNPDTRQEIFSANCVSWIPTHQGALDGIDTTNWIAYKDRNAANGEKLLPIFSYNDTPANMPLADNPTEYQMADFRSWNQQPAIFVWRLWQWYKEQFENITGYQLELDSGWFNQQNPYVNNLHYTLPKLEQFTAVGDNTVYADTNTQENNWQWDAPFIFSTAAPHVRHFTIASRNFVLPNGYFGGTFKLNWFANIVTNPQSPKYIPDWERHVFRIIVSVYSANNVLRSQKKFGLAFCPYQKYNSTDYLTVSDRMKNWMNSNCDSWDFYQYQIDGNDNYQYVFASEYGKGIDLEFNALIYNGDYIQVETECLWEENAPNPNQRRRPFVLEQWDSDGRPVAYNGEVGFTAKLKDTITLTGENTGVIKTNSYSPVTLERLFASENPFEVLLKYTKYLNLVWLVDEVTKKVRVCTRSQHFFDCLNENGNLPNIGSNIVPLHGILDLSDRVNIAKDVKVLPIDWNDKYIYLNFEKSEADFLEEYGNQFGRTYGSKLLQTPNKRVKSQKEFFENAVVEACDITPYFISIGSTITKPTAYKADRLLLNCKDDNKKTANLHGQFVFRNPNSMWNPQMYKSFRYGVLITDDTDIEVNEQKTYYHGQTLQHDILTYRRPVFSPVHTDSNTCFWFAFPRQAFAPVNYADNTKTLFELWQNYLYEIYNVNNKTIQVYINLSSSHYKRLKINPLCQIDNCVYIVMEMDGYNENTEFVKCTLKQFGSTDNLTAGAVVPAENDVWLWDDTPDSVVLWDNGAKIPTADKNTLQPSVLPLYPPIIDPDTTPVLPATPIACDLPTIVSSFNPD